MVSKISITIDEKIKCKKKKIFLDELMASLISNRLMYNGTLYLEYRFSV